ncbi:hypothetical protein F1880_001075 [Penicillium rolfsii]|nr:hypothetical protein F1880_001075 [Penicillium rolfsii]
MVRLESQFARHGTARLSLSELNTDVLKSGFTSPDSTKSGSPELYFDPSAFSERQSSTSDGSRSNLSSQEQGQKLASPPFNRVYPPLAPYCANENEQANRRIQNRAAQRRFRERRDEQNKILQAKLAELQENYQKLSEELTKKSEEVSHLRSENEGLRAEVRNQRQRWRSIVLLLQRPKSLQLLSMLVGGEQGTEGSEADSGIGDFDRYLRCLDAFTLSDDKA